MTSQVSPPRGDEAPPAGNTGGGDGAITMPRLGPRGWLRWAWRQLTSMRTALLLLVLLAMAAVPGSIWPQRRGDPTLVADYLNAHTTVGPWLDRLWVFDVYTSPWFSAIYLLLFISLIGCVLPRSRVHLAALRSQPPATPSRLDRLPAHARAVLRSGVEPDAVRDVEQDVDQDVDRVLAAAEAELRRRRFRVARRHGVRGRGPSVAAETGYLAETGNLVFHLALVGLLVTLAWGSLATYAGQVTVTEGRTFANVVTSYDSFSSGPLVNTGTLAPFTARLDALDVSYEADATTGQLGAPRRFEAHLTVSDAPGEPERRVVVAPNRPLDVAGARGFLVGNGYAPVVTVRDGTGEVVFSGPVISRPMDGNYKSVVVIKAPDAQPRQIGLVGVFLPTYEADESGVPVSLFPDAIDPKLVLQVFLAEPGQDGLGADSGVPQSVFQLDTGDLTRMEVGDGTPLQLIVEPGVTETLPEQAGSVTFDGFVRFAAFDIRRDPSKEWALVFSVLAIAGVSISLFVRRRRIWVRVGIPAGADPIAGASGGGPIVEVAGLARRDDPALAREVAEISAALVGDDDHEHDESDDGLGSR